MTHAALKDLVKKWREEAAEARASGARAQKRGNQDYAEVLWQAGNDAEAYADELSAALSAMEGEAKPVAWGFPNSRPFAGEPSLMMVRLEVPADDQYAGKAWIPLYTAPPPQQAATPPSHQPGEVASSQPEAATEAMIRAGGKALYGIGKNTTPYERTLPDIRATMEHMAAVVLTAALAPKEAGHG